MTLKNTVPFLGLLITLAACSEESATPKLQGTWINSSQTGLQFIEFTSDNQGRFGYFEKDEERYDNFTYRISDKSIAIDLTGDDAGETIHDLSFSSSDKITISNISANAEGQPTTYIRNNIKTDNEGNEVVLGVNEIYFDFDSGHALKIDTVVTDSRCPANAQCVWEGYAAIRFSLTDEELHEHFFELMDHERFGQDTLLQGVTYRLIQVTPYPEASSSIDYADYKVLVQIEK